MEGLETRPLDQTFIEPSLKEMLGYVGAKVFKAIAFL
jgi:hypothetical protein